MLARILIAEDDPRQAEIVRRYLQAAGWDPVVVGDGRPRSLPFAGGCPTCSCSTC
ncbi:hypothetical protein [Actinoplanes derwentensis]|uniref:hypothetical protein n=1 Tax=Actinoplanes derwentensis TaxID=113562 RepID=UPI0027DAB8EB|nr:hypothetical protein [Actinoplanes derwentensis]